MTGQEIEAKTKAVRTMRKLVGWTRMDWINEVESALGEAFISFCKARLARKNRQQRRARAWEAEFERRLIVRVIDIHCHPVKRGFDRDVAFEQAVTEMTPGHIPALQEYVERQFAKADTKIRRKLDEADVKEFWKTVRWATRLLTGEGGRGPRVRGSSPP